MKKLMPLVLLLVVIQTLGLAQNAPTVMENNLLTVRNVETVYDPSSVYILPEWKMGKVIFGNGTSENVVINYNAHNDRLEQLNNGQMLTINQPVNAFVLGDTSLNEGILFKSGYAATDKQSEYSFYQVLYQSPSRSILRYIHFSPKEEKKFNDATDKIMFIPVKNYYAADEAKNLTKVKKSVKSVVELFPTKSSAIETHVKENKIKLRKWSDFVNLVAFAERL